jgi:septum formation protein
VPSLREMQQPPSIVLASRSPRRLEILLNAGFRVETLSFETVEDVLEGESATAYVERIARAKLRAAQGLWTQTLPRWILTADTTVSDGDASRILGKPITKEQACSFLQSLSAQTHKVQTCFALGDGERAETLHVETVTTEVEFRALTSDEIHAYVETGEPFDKAGGYGIQGGAAHFVRALRGSYTNVVGLPAAELVLAYRKFAK